MKIKQISPVMPLIVVFLIGDAAFGGLGYVRIIELEFFWGYLFL